MKSLAFGEILWDVIEGKAHIGGAPFNLSAHMTKMGANSYIISSLGNDKYGKNAFNCLEKLNVNTDYVSFSDNYPTGIVDVVLHEGGMPEYTINEGSAWDNINLSDEALDSILSENWDVFCFGSLAQRTDNNRSLLKRVFENLNAKHIFYDVNLRQHYYSFDVIDYSMKNSTIVKINDDEAKLLSEMIFDKEMSERDFAVALSEKYDLNLICITRGSKGAAVYSDEEFIEIQGNKVKVADTVGAGDSFSAGLLTAYLNGQSPEKSVELANKIGGYVASCYGAIPDYSEEHKNEIKQILKNQQNKMNTNNLIKNAWKYNTVIPAFNIPYLPMMEPVTRALKDTDSVGLIAVARLEWEKFEAKSLKAVYDEFVKCDKAEHTRLHLDHVPVIDEDNLRVDFLKIIEEAISLGYQSVMVDGSRLPFSENIECTAKVVELAHKAGVPVEAELGAVLGHESGPKLDYEEIFKTGKGFTDPVEAAEFVQNTQVDWLSVAVGNIHGAISDGLKDQKKPEARINIEHLAKINDKAGVPLVLHGGSGINLDCIHESVKNGIAKINVGTAIRQPYEQLRGESILKAQDKVYELMLEIIKNEFKIEGNGRKLQK